MNKMNVKIYAGKQLSNIGHRRLDFDKEWIQVKLENDRMNRKIWWESDKR